MKLEEQVVSLELAKKLKELGVKQESLFYLHQDGIGVPHFHPTEGDCNWSDCVSAFTVAELGDMLPENTNTFKEPVGKREWVCTRNEPGVMLSFHANTEADVRAKMLVYLIENKLI